MAPRATFESREAIAAETASAWPAIDPAASPSGVPANAPVERTLADLYDVMAAERAAGATERAAGATARAEQIDQIAALTRLCASLAGGAAGAAAGGDAGAEAEPAPRAERPRAPARNATGGDPPGGTAPGRFDDAIQ